MRIQLPNDVVSCGYRKTGAFQFEQVFKSEKHNFTGTEKEFIREGIGYEYSHDLNGVRYF